MGVGSGGSEKQEIRGSRYPVAGKREEKHPDTIERGAVRYTMESQAPWGNSCEVQHG